MNEFISAMRNEGLIPPSDITPGIIHRFPGAGKNESNRAGYCLLFTDGLGGIFGDWSTGFSATWRSAGTQYLTPLGWSAFNASVERARREAQEQREAAQEEAAESAVVRWETASPAPEDHPYLIAKGIKSYGLRYHEDGNLLLMPIHDLDGTMTSCQTIAPNGEKRLMKGGRKKGCAFTINGDATRTFVVEGYATGASVHDATGCAVIVAIDAGNMFPVVESLIKRGTTNIVIAADNDHGKEPNTGIEAAKSICSKYLQVEYITPPAINEKPTDWNDYAIAYGADAVKKLLINEPEIAVREHSKRDDMTLQIPDELLNASELFSLGMQAARDMSSLDIPQLLFPVVLTHISTAIAGKIRIHNHHPSFFCIKVAPTSIGKTSIDKNLTLYIRPAFNITVDRNDGKPKETLNTFYGPVDFSSGPALRRAVCNKPRSLIIIDEISNLFSGRDDKKPDILDKARAILELSTSAGTESDGTAYAKEIDNIKINNHTLNMTGNATPSIFADIKHADLTNGFVNRMDIYTYMGKFPYHKKTLDSSEAAERFKDKLLALRNTEKPAGRFGIINDKAVNIEEEKAARDSMEDFSLHWTDRKNEIWEKEDEGKLGIIGRIYESAYKYALAFHANAPENLFEPLTLREVELGQRMAMLLVNWKLDHLLKNISSGEFNTICMKIKQGIGTAMRQGKKPSWAVLCNVRKSLANIDIRRRDDAMKMLIEAEEVRPVVAGRKTYYYLLRPQ